MLFYELSDLNNLPENINYPDIYFTLEYGKVCKYSDDAIWELCNINSSNDYQNNNHYNHKV